MGVDGGVVPVVSVGPLETYGFVTLSGTPEGTSDTPRTIYCITLYTSISPCFAVDRAFGVGGYHVCFASTRSLVRVRYRPNFFFLMLPSHHYFLGF